MDVLGAIGNTSIVRLREVVDGGGAKILAKLEWENPTGSLKDRMARAVISRAEADGRLKPGGTVVEYTGGSAGASRPSLRREGIPSPDRQLGRVQPREARPHGGLRRSAVSRAERGGKTTRKLILDMIETARQFAREPGAFWADQLHNLDSLEGYAALGEEIWNQTEGKIDAFVHCVGTGASLRGVAEVLKKRKPEVRIVAVEPAESPVLGGGQPGPHKIEGVGIGYVPPLWEPSLVDEVVAVSTEDSKEMARRLAKEEALSAGTSSGANVPRGDASGAETRRFR